MKFDPTPVIQPHLIWQFFFAPLVTVLTGFFLKTDTMDKWDQSKLEEVIEKKHGEKEKSMPKTEIVSSLLWHGSN